MGKKTSSRSDASTRAERKFEKKVQFYDKVRNTVIKKTIQKKNKRSQRKKLEAYDLSTLSEVLPELKAPKQPKFKLNSKSRHDIVLRETNQLNTVLNNPMFQSDPLAAIHQHLQSTQPVEEKPKRKNTKSGKKTKMKKKKKPKASSGPQTMEI